MWILYGYLHPLKLNLKKPQNNHIWFLNRLWNFWKPYKNHSEVSVEILTFFQCRRIRRTHVRRRRAAWVYPRPQGWFEEMYQNPVFSTLWKNDFRVTKETFDYICQLVGPDLSRQNTRFRKAVALNKRVAIALGRMGTGNSYRTTGITFGQGKIYCNKDMWKLYGNLNTPQRRFPDDGSQMIRLMLHWLWGGVKV